MDDELTFGQWLKRRRRGMGLTQRALGEQLGYSSETIRKVEADELRPSRQFAERLALALELNPAEWARFVRFARDEPVPSMSPPLSTQTVHFPPAAPPHHNLPAPLTSFIGREKEIAEVRQLLGRHRLVTLTGAGGMGKSRLSLKVAHGVLDAYPHGVWLVELAALSDPTLVPQAVAQVLGVRGAPGQPIATALADYVRDKSLLLVLDNCEHLIAACTELAQVLLQAGPAIHLLTTSREALGIAGETTYYVSPLAVPPPDDRPELDRLVRFEALQLFIERAANLQPEFRVTSSNAPAVTEICRRLNGIPLAIELAAARLQLLSVEQVATRLDDRFRLLTQGSRTALPRHRTLRAAMDWSHDLLSSAERTLFRRLAVFAGGWTLEAAENICADEALPQSAILDLLASLVGKSLVTPEPHAPEPHYHLLETIRQYAAERLEAAGETEGLRSRHLAFYITLAERAEPYLQREEQVEWLARLDADHDNLRAALAWAFQVAPAIMPDASLRLVSSLARYWIYRGYHLEAYTWLERALAQGEPRPSAVRARTLYYYAGSVNSIRGAHHSAPIHAASLAMAEAVGDTATQALALVFLGHLDETEGETISPRQARALDLFEQMGDDWCQANTLNHMSQAKMASGNYAIAEALMQRALNLWRQTGDRARIAHALAYLGEFARARGELQRAATFVDEALLLAHESGAQEGITFSLGVSARLALLAADYDRAQRLFEANEANARRIGSRYWALASQGWRGVIACRQGDYVRAVKLQEDGLDELRPLGAPGSVIVAQTQLGWTHLHRGDTAQACALIEPAVDYFGETSSSPNRAYALCGLGHARLVQGDYPRALGLLQAAIAVGRRNDDAWMMALSLLGLGRLALKQGELGPARQHLGECLALAQRMGTQWEIAEVLRSLATLCLQHEAIVNAAWLFGAAETLRRQIGAPVPLVDRLGYQQEVDRMHAGPSSSLFKAAWVEGSQMGLAQVVERALDTLPMTIKPKPAAKVRK